MSHLRSSDTCASDAQLLGIRNPVTHPPCCSCGSAHALSSRVEPRAASFAVTRHSCSAALVSWYRVSLCVRSSDRGESRSAERRARMVVVCLGPFPIPRIAVRQLGVSTFVLLYCYTYCYRCLPSYWQLLLEGPHSPNMWGRLPVRTTGGSRRARACLLAGSVTIGRVLVHCTVVA